MASTTRAPNGSAGPDRRAAYTRLLAVTGASAMPSGGPYTSLVRVRRDEADYPKG